MSSAEEPKVTDASQDQNDEWIVQSKPRRLVPQHSLSRQDLEADKGKVAPAVVDPKKKVIRFTKEEMMTFRQPVKILPSMAEMVEVISTERLNPVCFERFEPEDVIRIWNTEKNGPNKNVDGGRGRGRGKTFKNEDGEPSAEWGEAAPRSNKGGLWDDAGATSSGADGMDLSDFAAMAQKFRSEMEQMKLNGDGEEAAPEQDTMTMLAREQDRRAGGIEDEDDTLPDWATDEPAPQPAAKRSLLLETLNVKKQTETAPVVSHSASYGIGAGLDLNVASAVRAAPIAAPAPAPQPVLRVETEWQYTDPQGQVQGPFEQENMRQWHEAGYFNAELPIKMKHWQRFHAFQTVFPDFKLAFLNVPQEPSSGSLILSLQQQQLQQQQAAAALLRQQQEEQRREQERLAQEAQQRRQAQIEAEQRAQLEHQRQQEAQRQAEAARQAEHARQQQLALQQQQAQQILLQQQQQAEVEAQRAMLEAQRQAAAAAATPASPTKPAPVAPWANKQPGPNRGQDLAAIQNEEAAAREAERKRAAAEQAKVSKGWTAPAAAPALSLAEIQQQEEALRQRQLAEAARNAAPAAPATTNMSSQLKNLLGVKTAPAPAPVSTGPAWGAGAAAPAKGASSLRDIMQEEDSGRVEDSEAARAAPIGGRKPTSWAAKAGGTTFTAPESVQAAPRAAPRVAAPAPAPVVAAAAPAPASVPAARPAASVKPATKEKSSFGGKDMSPEMASWCAAKLKSLNGSEDLTLVQFCMSLDSAAEIRQYLSEYLGSSPAVTNFATDFIKFKEGGRKAVEGAASSASGAPAGGNSNNPSNFVVANKKKKAPTTK